MPATNLFFKDKFKFLQDAFTNSETLARNIREYLDRNIPDRFRSISNIFNLTIDVVRDLSTLHLLHYEDAMNELNVFTAQHEGNQRGLAQLTGHVPVLPISARGTVRIEVIKAGLNEFGNSLIIQPDAVFRNLSNGRDYVLQREQSVQFQTNVAYKFVDLIQGKRISQSFTVDTNSSMANDRLFVVNLDDTDSIENYYLKVYVNNELWEKSDSLYDMTLNSKTYLKRAGYGNQMDIVFGTGRHGKKLQVGDNVRIEYITTAGQAGNVDFNQEFQVISGITDIAGNEINASEYFKITKESGLDLASNGEHPETTRAMTGYSSRSLTFARPENITAFLSRLSILSHITAWTLEDDLVFRILALPRIVLANASDYLSLPMDRFQLSKDQEDSIRLMLENSRRSWVGTEFVFEKPIIKQYAVFVYAVGNVYDRQEFKTTVERLISEIMLKNTFGDVDKDASNANIAISDMINAIHDLPDVDAVNIDIISKDNEDARIQGWYLNSEVEVVGGVRRIVERRIDVPAGNNPTLGLSAIGNIETNRNEVPILRGNFDMYQDDLNHETLPENGVMVFLKDGNEWPLIS